MNKFILSLIGASMLGTVAFAQDKAQEVLKPMSLVEAQAMCQTLFDSVTASQASVQTSESSLVSLKKADVCETAIEAVYKRIGRDSNERFIGGLGMFMGADLNLPGYKMVTPGGRISGGASGFVLENTQTAAKTVRFAPLFSIVPISVQKSWVTTPDMLEGHVGFVIYIGSPTTKQISDFNGIYAGINGEGPNVFVPKLRTTTSLSVGGYKSLSGSGAMAVTLMLDFTGGDNMNSVSAQVIDFNNIDKTGYGKGVGDILSLLSRDFSDAGSNLWQSIREDAQALRKKL